MRPLLPGDRPAIPRAASSAHGEQDVQNAADTGHDILRPFSGRKNMDLGAGHMDLIRQRSDKIGVELILQLCMVT